MVVVDLIKELVDHYRHSFRVRLFLALTLVILLFIPLTGYVSYRQAQKIAENQMQQYARATAEQIVNKVSSFLSQHSNNVALIKSLIEDGFIDPYDNPVMLRYFELFRSGRPEFVNIYYGDERGRFLMLPPQLPEVHKIYDPRLRPWYRGAALSEKLHWTDVYLFASSRRPGITVSVPVFEERNLLRGVCGIDIDLSQFSRFLQGIEMQKQGIAYIFENRRGHVIAHSGLVELVRSPDQINLARESISTLKSSDTSSGLTSFRGKDYFTALTGYPGQDWTVGVTLSMSEYYQNIQLIKQTTLSLVILGVLLSSLLSLLLTRAIVRPLEQLHKGIDRISRGDLNYKVTIDDPDIASDLARSFNRMAASLRSSLDKLQEASGQLAKKEKLAAVGQMTASIAHEIKNPLGIIHGAAQVVANSKKPYEMREKAANFIIAEVERLNKTITSFLAFAKPAPPNFAELDVVRCIEETLSAVEERYSSEGYQFKRKYSEQPLPSIEADGDQIRQVLWNIFLNAFEAMPDGGTITLSVREESTMGDQLNSPVSPAFPFEERVSWLVVSIEDNGCGMSEEQQQKVMDPFVSFRDGGTGLGLSIIDQVMKMHRGTVRITSGEGLGTTFHLSFPCRVKEN